MMMIRRAVVPVLAFGVVLAGAVEASAAPKPPPVETCIATWQGEPGDDMYSTASGEPFDPLKPTAGHRNLPFGTRVKVTRVDDAEHASVIVRINDRGPGKRRCVNLSRSAFEQLAPLSLGIIKVSVEVLPQPPAKPPVDLTQAPAAKASVKTPAKAPAETPAEAEPGPSLPEVLVAIAADRS